MRKERLSVELHGKQAKLPDNHAAIALHQQEKGEKAMGKAKRLSQQKSNIITLGKLAWKCYEKHGKGICAYKRGHPFSYLQSENLIEDYDCSFLKRYDPEKEFILTYTLGDESDLWLTGIFSYSHEKANARIIIPKDSSLENILENCLL